MNSRAGRGGFTLIELLVVITILGVLVALLIPALQQVREGARRMTCRSHLRQFGLALHQYAETHGSFPRICLEGRGTSTYLTGWQGFSVHSMLLPYLDQQSLYQQIDFNRSFRLGVNDQLRKKALAVFLCPSDYGGKAVEGAGNNYVVSGGPSLIMLSPIPGQRAGGTPGTSIGVGDQIGMFNMRRMVAFRDLTDGVSQTLAASEAIIGDGDRARFAEGDLVRGTAFPAGFPNTFPSPSQLDEYGRQCLENRSLHYSDPHGEWMNGMPAETAFNTLHPPNSPYPDCHENVAYGWYDSRGVWSARSRHASGVHALLADGSCRYISNSIHLPTWHSLGAIADGRPLADF